MATQGFEERVRTTYFDALRRRQAPHGEVLSAEVAREPIVVDGEVVKPSSSATTRPVPQVATWPATEW